MDDDRDTPNEMERVSAELLDELASNERRTQDPKQMPARFHNLRAVAVSPAHGLASFSAFHETLATRIGSGTHAMLFGLPVLCLPPHIKQRRGKNFDLWKKDQDPKALILTRGSFKKAQDISASVLRHETACNLLFGPGTIREQTIRWTQHGRLRQSTPDVRGEYHLCELKTTRCSEPGKFIRDAAFRSYHVQLADQRAAILAETGRRMQEVYLVAVESVDPFPVTVFQVSDATLLKGERLAELWLDRLIGCEASNHWPAYSTGIEMLDIPDDGLDVWEEIAIETPEWKVASTE